MNIDQASTLGGKKFLAHQAIDLAAGRARSQYITDVPGQAATYLLKMEQAYEFLAAHELDPVTAAAKPFIAAEAAATGQTPLQLAQSVVAQAALWRDVLGPAIEAARMAGKLAVSQATTAEEVRAALDAAEATLAAL